MVKVMIPVSDDTGKVISQHFGRAPFWAWYIVDSGKISDSGVVPNDSDHFGGIGSPPEKIASLGMGMKAINLFQEAKIAVLNSINLNTLENIQEFIKGNLIEQTEGCLHEH